MGCILSVEDKPAAAAPAAAPADAPAAAAPAAAAAGANASQSPTANLVGAMPWQAILLGCGAIHRDTTLLFT